MSVRLNIAMITEALELGAYAPVAGADNVSLKPYGSDSHREHETGEGAAPIFTA